MAKLMKTQPSRELGGAELTSVPKQSGSDVFLMEPSRRIEAIVEHGDARGRTMGFPTANMHLADEYSLAFGIYAVRVGILLNGDVESWHDGVANFGIRPMYRIAQPLLEAHLFDFDGDLYGRTMRVEFVAFLRPEAAFADLQGLIAQIHLDAQLTRDILNPFTRGGIALASIA